MENVIKISAEYYAKGIVELVNAKEEVSFFGIDDLKSIKKAARKFINYAYAKNSSMWIELYVGDSRKAVIEIDYANTFAEVAKIAYCDKLGSFSKMDTVGKTVAVKFIDGIIDKLS